MKKQSLRSLGGRGRVWSSDFKCPCPGHDEAELLQELARGVGLEVQIADVAQSDPLYADGGPSFTAHVAGEATRLHLKRAKYYFPPRELIDFLNTLLARTDSALRFVALAGGREAESVAALTPAELAAARAAGYRQVHPLDEP